MFIFFLVFHDIWTAFLSCIKILPPVQGAARKGYYVGNSYDIFGGNSMNRMKRSCAVRKQTFTLGVQPKSCEAMSGYRDWRVRLYPADSKNCCRSRSVSVGRAIVIVSSLFSPCPFHGQHGLFLIRPEIPDRSCACRLRAKTTKKPQ